MHPKWMTQKKIAETTGLTEEAIRSYKKKGLIREKVHFIKAANGRIMIHYENFNRFLEGKDCGEVR